MNTFALCCPLFWAPKQNAVKFDNQLFEIFSMARNETLGLPLRRLVAYALQVINRLPLKLSEYRIIDTFKKRGDELQIKQRWVGLHNL